MTVHRRPRHAFAIALAALGAPAAAPAHGEFPGRNGRLAIESDRFCGRDGNDPFCSRAAVYVTTRDGRRLRRITRQADDFRTPAWAPDGKRLYVTGRDGLYVLRPDGSRLRRVGPAGGRDFAIAPDGRRLAWTFTPPAAHAS